MKNGLCLPETFNVMRRLLDRYGLSTAAAYPMSELFDLMVNDKKSSGDAITFVLPRETGRCELKKLTRAEWTALLS